MWVWRRMLKVPWTIRHANVHSKGTYEPVKLNVLFEKRMLGYFRCVVRRNTGTFEGNEIFFGKRGKEKDHSCANEFCSFRGTTS